MLVQHKNSVECYQFLRLQEKRREINKKRPNVIGSGVLAIIVAFFCAMKREYSPEMIVLILLAITAAFVAGWALYCLYVKKKSSPYDRVILAEERCRDKEDCCFRFSMSEAITKVIQALEYGNFRDRALVFGIYDTKIDPKEEIISIESDFFGNKQQIQCEIATLLARANALGTPCTVRVKGDEKQVELLYLDGRVKAWVRVKGQSPKAITLNSGTSYLSRQIKVYE